MTSRISKLLSVVSACALISVVGGAHAQDQFSIDALIDRAQPGAPVAGATRQPIAAGEVQGLRGALAAARSGDRARFSVAYETIGDPAARKLASWAMIDAAGEQLSFYEIDQARRDLAEWPRGARRQGLAERKVETSGLDPAGIVQWFGDAQPQTAEGAMALASAHQAAGRQADAQKLIRGFWVGKVFEADVQRTMLSRFGAMLSPEDHVLRADFLLYGPQGPAARDMLALLSPDQRAAAEARIALRSGARGAADLVERLPTEFQNHPGVRYERLALMRRQSGADTVVGMASSFPPAPGYSDADTRMWTERRNIINAALRRQDYQAAYAAATNHGLTAAVDLTDAEFYAGWLALSKLKDPAKADEHFARIQAAGKSPITQARALYWRGRAHEAMGDAHGATNFYTQGGRHITTFYGQLAAEKAGLGPINIGTDPVITEADRARFEGRDVVKAARIVGEIGDKSLFRTFLIHIDDDLPSAADYALLVDMAREFQDQELSMLVVRAGATKGFVLPERGYPLRSIPQVATSAEAAFVYGIVRQESGFDPKVRSEADARGMMQLLPSTAQLVARRLGVSYTVSQLYDGEYNMRLGAYHLGELTDQFSGSYLMAAAGYNAGPGRPREWISFCGDPRSGGVDPLDFIECIPFSETRNYVMRVMEGMQVYRARLGNGVVQPALSADLKRGGYVYAGGTPTPTAF